MANHTTEPATLITEYLEKKGPEMHEAFTVESSFNKLNLKYEVTEEYHDFREALQQYKDDKLGFNPADCSWTVVLEELRKAKEAAAASEQRGKGFFTKNRRKISRLSTIIIPALEALPDYLSVLHGGLAVIFHIAQHREKNRQEIIDTFEDIPEIIAKAHSKLDKFPDDEGLHDSIENLKTTLFGTIPSLVDLLRPGTFLAKVRIPFRGYDVDQLLDLVEKSASRVETCYESLRDDLIFKTYRGTEEIRRTTKTTGSRVDMFDKSISTVGEGVRNLNEQYEGIDSRISELTQSQHFIFQQVTDALSSQNGMFQMLKDAVLKHLYEEDVKVTMNRSWTPSQQISSPGQLTAIFNKLHVPHLQAIHDLASILRQSQRFDSAAKSHTALVLKSDQFQRWITVRGSDLIHIEAHFDSSRFGKTSPISYFCAMLAQVLQGVAMNTTLHFFCSQHVAAIDDLRGPRGLIRSLLAQLVLEILQNRPNHPLDTTKIANYGGNVESIPTEELSQVFQHLLRQIPGHVTVFCLIDDITRFERDSWSEDYDSLMRMLDSATSDNQGVNANFKVLMTSPTKSRWLRNKLTPAQHIDLRGSGQSIGSGTERALWRATREAM